MLALSHLFVLAHYSLHSVSGNVKIDSNGKQTPAAKGMTLKASDYLIIPEGGKVEIYNDLDKGIYASTKSKNTGKQAAINNAVITYAQEAGSTLKGRVISDLNANGVDPAGEFDNFYAAYERLVEKEIRGEMQPSYTIIRTNPDKTYEIRTYFIVSELAASRARMRALEEAMKASEAAQKHAAKISEFVKQGFDQ